MPKSRSTSVCLVVRTQAWFSASVVLETLGPFNAEALDQFPLPNPNTVNIRSWLGRGPCAHNIGASATLYFDHGDELYPTFAWPSVSPKGSSAYTTPVKRTLVVDEHAAIFCLEAAASIPVAPELFDKAREGFDESTKLFVRDSLNGTRNIVNSLVGAYALYQYPLVWEYMDKRHQWMIIDVDTKVGKGAFEERQMDNWVPFKLDTHAKINNGMLQDGITKKVAELIKDEFRQPLVFLKDSMWHTDIRTRFLLQFWILEYFAEKYYDTVPENEDIRIFVHSLEEIVAARFQPFVDYFKSRKGELTRLTLAQKVQACFGAMRIKYDGGLFKRAKAVRDSLSHAGEFKEDELREMELYLREIVRHVIRRDLELNGIFLDGVEKQKEELEEIIPAYPDPSKRLTKAFGPLEVK